MRGLFPLLTSQGLPYVFCSIDKVEKKINNKALFLFMETGLDGTFRARRDNLPSFQK